MVAPQGSSAVAATEWKVHNDGATGFRVAYPAGWSVKPHPENECAFKITGTENGYLGDFQLRTSSAGISPKDLAKLVRQHIWSASLDFKEIGADENAHFGRNNRLAGAWHDVTFKTDNLPLRQRWYFTQVNDHNFMVVLTSPESAWTRLSPLFNQMLSTFERNTGGATTHSVSPATSGSRSQSWEFVPLPENAQVPLKISVPKNWTVTRDAHGDDIDWKITGVDAQGKDAEIKVFTGLRGELTLDRFVDIMEDEHFKPLPNYALASKGRRTVGGVEAITHSITFTMGGVPARMNTMFFADREHVYCVGLTSAAMSPAEMQNLMDRVAGSIRL